MPVWAPSISLAATLEIDVSFFSSPYLDVSVQAVPRITLWIHVMLLKGFLSGFPHSDISGSMDMCSSPELFAAYHVFLRLLVPRHPPCALFCLTSCGIALPLSLPLFLFHSKILGFLFLAFGSFDVLSRFLFLSV